MDLMNRLGLRGTSLLLVLAACNAPPSAPGITVEGVAADGSERAEGEAFTIDQLRAVVATEAVDENGDPIEYRYAWSRDGDPQGELSQDTVSGAFTEKGQVWEVNVTAFDGKDTSTAGRAEITIANSPPTATVTFSPEVPVTTSTVRLSTEKMDDDRDATSIRYVWIVNGSPQTLDGDILSSERTTKGEVWEVQVIPTDGEIEGEPAIATFTIANTPPEVVDAALSSDAPNKGSDLTCVGSGWEDDDGDPEGYKTEWFVNGVSYSTEDVLPALPLDRGDRIRCELTAFDGEDEGNTVSSNEATLQNTPPLVTSVTIGPENPLKDDSVGPTIEGAVDPDGDEITYEYEWYIGGALASTTETLPPSRFRKGDRIQLFLRPFDGTDYGETVESNTIQAANNPPTLAEVRLSPTSPYTDDVIVAEAFTSDPDGDDVIVNYQWFVNGSKVTATTEELDGASFFDKGDTIYAIATPTDRDESGAALTTSTLTAINSIPTAPDLVLDPVKPTGSEDVVCEIVEASVDADKDTLSYTFTWTVEGSLPSSTKTTTYTNDTLPASAHNKDDVLICTVVANDGTENSPEATAGTEYGSKDRPGVDCQDIIDENSDAETGTFWIDPDEDGDITDAFEVVCDMDSDGGGWTLVYYADAEHFDGYYVNSTDRSSTAPKKLNDQKDIWNIPSDLDHTETLLGCTTQNDAATHWWQYNSTNPYQDWNGTIRRTTTVSRSATDRSSGSPTAACYRDWTGSPSALYGFATISNSTCNCRNILWGANHYASSATWTTGCNLTSTSYGNHTSKWRSRSITYPICNRSQTTNGKFWIGVR